MHYTIFSLSTPLLYYPNISKPFYLHVTYPQISRHTEPKNKSMSIYTHTLHHSPPIWPKTKNDKTKILAKQQMSLRVHGGPFFQGYFRGLFQTVSNLGFFYQHGFPKRYYALSKYKARRKKIHTPWPISTVSNISKIFAEIVIL